MNRRHRILTLAVAALALVARTAGATTVIGDLNNFDTINDTGQTCYGFEIEIDDIHSTDITYTFDWNHYGTPKIREDNTDPLHPKVFVRYESARDTGGALGANGSFTNVAIPFTTTLEFYSVDGVLLGRYSAPVAAKGWPNAIEEPITFILERSMEPSGRSLPSTRRMKSVSASVR